MFFQISFGFILCFHFRFVAVDAVSKSDDEEHFTTRRIFNRAPVGVLLAKRMTRSVKTCQAQYSTVPKDCWLLRACFQKAKQGNCFNGHCDADENVDNCPADCCPVRSRKSCSLQDGVCPSQCCGDSTCCKTSSGKRNTALTVVMYIGIVILIIVVGVVGEWLRRKYCGFCIDVQVHPSSDDTSSTSSDSDVFCLACLCSLCCGCD